MRLTKNWNWSIERDDSSGNFSCDQAQLSVLMDIRDELQTLNNVFRCHNALAIPQLLRDIKRNTTKPKRRKKAA
jgi:hypothetical protein